MTFFILAGGFDMPDSIIVRHIEATNLNFQVTCWFRYGEKRRLLNQRALL